MMNANSQPDPELNAKMRSKLLSVLIFPAVISGVGLIITVFFMVRMLPSFMEIFDGFQIELPIQTKVLISISDYLRNPINLIILGGVLALALNSFVRRCSNPVGFAMVSKYAMPTVIILNSLMVGFLLWAIFSAMFSTTCGIYANCG